MRTAPPVVALCLTVVALAPARAQGPTRVGVLLDGPSAYGREVLAAFQQEITAFFGAEQVVEFPESLVRAGDWTAAGARAELDRLFADPLVSVVLALGPIGSHELARRSTVPKPAIAALIIDAVIEQLPTRDGASGVRNLCYVDVAYGASRTLQLFHELIPFHTIAVLIQPGLLDAIPQLRDFAATRTRALGVALTFVPVTGSAAEALQAIPPDADAAYLTPLEQLPTAALDSLISGFRVRRLPSFSYTGRGEVERGALAAYAPKDDLSRRARRVAGLLQRIRAGEDAGTLPVALATVSQLTVNMATARAIGYAPDWKTRTEAELLHEQPPGTGPTWTLSAVAQEAVRANLDLQIADRELASSREDVRQARGALLPQVQAAASGTAIRKESAAASLGTQPERTTQGQVSASQVVVGDQTWARYAIAGHAQAARAADRRRTELDVVLDAVTAYLNVLRAKALASVERANAKTTRSNLELAELRERTGATSLADVYRWQAELAQARRSVLNADAQVQIAQVELNRQLNRPLEEAFQTADATVSDPALVTSEPRLLDYFANPETFRVFRDFTVAEGRAASPELRALDAAIAGQRRALTAAGRSLWLPTVQLQGAVSDVFSRDGAGSTPPAFGPITLSPPPDVSWSLRLQASLPLFTGLQRTAARSQASIDLDRLTLEQQAADLAVSARIRAALHQGGASWAGIEQARLAAEAADHNLALVTDAYSRGAVSIITLLDAQEAALSAGEAAANAVYDFLVDLMQVQRAVGQFDFFRSAEQRADYFRRLDAFYQAAGVAPVRR